ncbi:hypothetical protein ABID56_002543 [Alkalibacillus flavidus]|uniref:Uncharacterized protein n=1 Tax=Alkalibacillus flavidus TaxID=546021 RepID=A0ABV2KXV2_9BACI
MTNLNLQEFMHGVTNEKQRESSVENTKIVNTKVPVDVVRAFKLYCVQENRYHKEVYNEMLEHFLIKHMNNEHKTETTLNGTPVSLNYLETTNFEIEKDKLVELKEMKIKSRCSLKELYAQVIIQYLNDNEVDVV